MEDVVIISGVRTPIGKFQGALEPLSAPQLASVGVTTTAVGPPVLLTVTAAAVKVHPLLSVTAIV